MGNCWSCFKVPPQPIPVDQSSTSEIKEDTMELRRLFSSYPCTKGSLTSVRAQANKKSPSLNINSLNTIGSENCRLTTSNVNASSDNKQNKESDDDKINALFNQYKEPNEDIILADGIERLCDDLQLSPDDFKVLVLAWKLDAEQMCQFTRKEFVNGLKTMHVDSISSIQKRLCEIVQELSVNGDLFKDLYRFTFRFGLDVASGQRILPIDMAIVLWKLVFTIREPPLLFKWLSFLDSHHVRGIPRDTWNMFLNFAEVIGNDLGSYDDAEAWPSLFDDFVEYENDQMNQNITKDDIIKNSIKNNY
ncbi:DCN1-like protein 3 isoform X2 [Chelonus insularis]|uniref:DCN1-like protein 3 isoform X2 n=1 Tax=Chelonus insularis TaxID=460826 RepID=UPI00158ED46C|nr:DCN1-like protein 3 isoform X2 [Chelonus insularis]